MENQEPKKKPIWKRWWFWVLAVFVLMAIVSAGSEPQQTPTSEPASTQIENAVPAGEQKPTTTSPKEEKKPDLELVETHMEEGQFGERCIVGTVKNNSNREYGYVQVEINLYDDAGTQVGSTMANANNLEPGGTWKFKAPILEENASKYKVKDVTGF